MGLRSEVFSWRVPSTNEGRTYFLNVKENRMGDLYLTIVESKKHGETDFERHQVLVFEEDIEEFRRGMEKVLTFMRESRDAKPGKPRAREPRSR